MPPSVSVPASPGLLAFALQHLACTSVKLPLAIWKSECCLGTVANGSRIELRQQSPAHQSDLRCRAWCMPQYKQLARCCFKRARRGLFGGEKIVFGDNVSEDGGNRCSCSCFIVLLIVSVQHHQSRAYTSIIKVGPDSLSCIGRAGVGNPVYEASACSVTLWADWCPCRSPPKQSGDSGDRQLLFVEQLVSAEATIHPSTSARLVCATVPCQSAADSKVKCRAGTLTQRVDWIAISSKCPP